MKLRKARNPCKKAVARAKSFDLFGSPVTLNVDGEDTVNSLPGLTLTVAVLIVLFIYFKHQVTILVSRKNPNITENLLTDAFDTDFNTTFSALDFKIAFAVEDYNTYANKVDPSYMIIAPVITT